MKALNLFPSSRMVSMMLVVSGALFVSSVSRAHGAQCADLFQAAHPADFMNQLIQNRSTLYTPIISTDTEALSKFKFDEGPSPQRNMALPPDPREQYIYSAESKKILELKAKITARNFNKVVQYLEGYEDSVLTAVQEQFERMYNEFPRYYPEIFEAKDGRLTNKLTMDSISRKELTKIDGPSEAIEAVGKLVQEDWLLMKRGASGEYEIIGGYLAFPTHWSLDRAMGWTLTQIHNNIPGTPESRAQFIKMIAMVLDRSLAAPGRVVVRNNWFIETDARYALPDYVRTTWEGATKVQEIVESKENKDWLKDLVCLRVERQTLRGLPKSGVVLFTIQPHVYTLDTVMKDSEVSGKVSRGLDQKYADQSTDPLIQMVKDLIRPQSPPK